MTQPTSVNAYDANPPEPSIESQRLAIIATWAKDGLEQIDRLKVYGFLPGERLALLHLQSYLTAIRNIAEQGLGGRS